MFYNTSIDFQDQAGKCITIEISPVDKVDTYF